MKGPLTRVSAGQGPFQHMVAGEGFEPSKLSRWIYSPLPLAARATCLGADGRIATQPRGSSNRGASYHDRQRHNPSRNYVHAHLNTPEGANMADASFDVVSKVDKQ